MDFTDTQEALLAVLSDGKPHDRSELLSAMDKLTDFKTVRVHISNIRKKLRPRGEEIVCEYANRRTFYRHVRLLPSANDGRS